MSLRLTGIGQLATCPADNPQGDAGLVNDAELVIADGRVAWAGPAAQLPRQWASTEPWDCQGRLVIPGLVDCHTHLCFGGWRGDEFEMRLQGHSYQEIAAAGGGIRHTVKHTRAASRQALIDKARSALDDMLALGVTTVECKSGYGLEPETELRQLRTYRQLDADHPVDLVPTFLGAHVIPDEYAANRSAYIELLCQDMLPRIAADGLAEFSDVFVEQGAYGLDEARQVLATARELGMGLKVHADQLSDGGGAALAAEMGAVSAEHLEYASEDGLRAMARAGTVAVSLPLASLYLREHYMPARDALSAGCRVAVATDFNPGSAPSYHLPLAMLLACINQSMTPQESLMGATTIAARAIARHDRIGSLRPGYLADIAVIDAPELNHWLYHFRPNACIARFKSGIEY
ncbi:imidazolonepropionase [Marinihelvus fidelis]|uniref:Imidazolonepropionase n=1 Tax=Marinihelvus fidelis TaxID=2613842 RepID=A0A5N0TA46_9GAMM|nr:imidazolonepropionase [Marinihelvus fidelis]KAA9131810.1 imidazolonepropionase [Marinihelvus fidelis]